MAAVSTTIAAIGLAIGAAGTAMSVKSQMDQAKAQNKAEAARKKAADLDALRRKRAAIRDMQQQRAVALSNATAQGASEGSGLQGAMAGVTGQGVTNIVGIEQQQQLGSQIFSANRQATKAASFGATGEGLQSLGGQLIGNAGTISSIGTSVGNSIFGPA